MDESPFFLFCHDLFAVLFLTMPVWHCCFFIFLCQFGIVIRF